MVKGQLFVTVKVRAATLATDASMAMTDTPFMSSVSEAGVAECVLKPT